MKDKDFLVVISEMLRKQDQQSELLSQQMDVLSQQSVTLTKIADTLNSFIDLSVNQFEQQQIFNEKFLDKLDNIGKK
ncbi:hypothetical protein [Pedobacter alpinus]|uniref:Uncharacterized protein n=1 Tax=Pedobacter alpinus TaxID=1590643 RepID=A0ABW5TQR3_9SPHI